MDNDFDYKEFADLNGYAYQEYSDKINTFTNASDIYLKYRLLEINDMIFYASDMYASQAYMNSTYSGIYIDLGENLEVECIISKRFPILDFFNRKNSVGNKYIDSSVTFKTDNMSIVSHLIDKNVIEQYLAIWDILSPVKITIGSGLIPHYKNGDNTIFGVVFNEWITVDTLKRIIPHVIRLHKVTVSNQLAIF